MSGNPVERELMQERAVAHGDVVPRTRPPLTLAVINYNGRAVLGDTLDSLLRVTYPDAEIVMFDDCSTDGSVEWVRDNYPDVRIVSRTVNGGKPSIVRNMALDQSTTRHVLLLDNDVSVDPECPDRLMDVMIEREGLLCCSPRLLYSDDPERIYHDGAGVHYLCITSGSHRGASVGSRAGAAPAPGIPGGNVLIDRERARQAGRFDENYEFGWGEDGELFVRGHVAGHLSMHVPAATACHVERERGLSRAEAQIYNRYRMILTVYSGRSLLLLAPPLLAFEVCLALMSAITGVLGGHVRAMRRTVGNHRDIRTVRRRIQKSRRVRDSEIFDAEDFFPTGALARSTVTAVGVRLVSSVFAVYWRVVRRWL